MSLAINGRRKKVLTKKSLTSNLRPRFFKEGWALTPFEVYSNEQTWGPQSHSIHLAQKIHICDVIALTL